MDDAERIKTLCRKLKPVIGDRADGLWLAYVTAESPRSKDEFAAVVELLAVKNLADRVDDDHVFLPPPSKAAANGEFLLGRMPYGQQALYPMGLNRKNFTRHLATATIAADTPERITYRLRLKSGETGDRTAEFLAATIVVHRPTRAIESFELASVGPFSPTFGVKIAEMRTTMPCSLPADGRPALLRESATHLRGRAFLVKSLDADLTVTFSDYTKARR